MLKTMDISSEKNTKRSRSFLLRSLAVLLAGCLVLPLTGCASFSYIKDLKDDLAERLESVFTADPSGSSSADTETDPSSAETKPPVPVSVLQEPDASFDVSEIPAWDGEPWIAVHDNTPFFTKKELTKQSFEYYGELDALGRCTGAVACVGEDLLPTGDRESISEIRPTGWHAARYAGIDKGFLYNRCHLIAYGLTAENANERNLITGTRYLNYEGMRDFEFRTVGYIRRTGNHVLYRVTPLFEGRNLLASGVLIEALSVEDRGSGLCFCVYAYNVQPGITIDYATGNSSGPPYTGGS